MVLKAFQGWTQYEMRAETHALSRLSGESAGAEMVSEASVKFLSQENDTKDKRHKRQATAGAAQQNNTA